MRTPTRDIAAAVYRNALACMLVKTALGEIGGPGANDALAGPKPPEIEPLKPPTPEPPPTPAADPVPAPAPTPLAAPAVSPAATVPPAAAMPAPVPVPPAPAASPAAPAAGSSPAPAVAPAAPAVPAVPAVPAPAPAPAPATTAPPEAAAQPAAQPVTQPAEQQTAQDAVHASVAAAAAPGATPEQKQKATQDFTAFMKQNMNQEFANGARDTLAGKNSPAAQQFAARLKEAKIEVTNEQLQKYLAENPNPTPEQYGGFLAQAQDFWHNLGTHGQMLVGLGGGAALVGMMMSMSGGEEGGGGMGGMLLGLLGLGAVGAGLTGAGVFGQGAKNTMTDTLAGLGQTAGFIPKQLTPTQKAILTAKDPVQAAMSAGGQGLTREQTAAQLEDVQRQLSQLKLFHRIGDAQTQARVFQSMGFSPAEAAQAVQNMNSLVQQHGDPNSPLSQQLQNAGWYADPNKSGITGAAIEKASPYVQRFKNWWHGPPETSNTKGASMNIAQQIYLQNEMMKAARCWAGYEPVPGKAPYSEDSCRPAGAKSTKKNKKSTKEKTAAQPYTGPRSSTPFDAVHAAQTLGMSAAAPPQQVYNRMMHMYRNNKFNPTQFDAFRSKYNGLPPQFSAGTAAAAPAGKPQAPVAAGPSAAPAPGGPAPAPVAAMPAVRPPVRPAAGPARSPAAAPISRQRLRPGGPTPLKTAGAPQPLAGKPAAGIVMPNSWLQNFKSRVQAGNSAMGKLVPGATQKKSEESCVTNSILPVHEAGEPTKQVRPKQTGTQHSNSVVTGGLGQPTDGPTAAG